MCLATPVRKGLSSVLLTFLVVAGGCTTAGSETVWTYPTDPDFPVLTVETAGGGPIGPPYHFADEMPHFVLYGDGRAFVSDPEHNPFDAANSLARPLTVRGLSADGIAALLDAAADAGLLGDPLAFGDPLSTERPPITTIEIIANGRFYRQEFPGSADSIFEEDPGDQVIENRRRTAGFLAALDDLSWLPEGSVGPGDEIVPDEFSVYFGAEQSRFGPPLQWPPRLPELQVEESAETGCVAVSPAQLDEVETVRADSPDARIRTWTGDGAEFRITVRPVLPHETACEPVS